MHYFEECQYMTTAEREQALPMTAHITKCLCELCTRSAEARIVSDMRRFLLRNLLYMVKRQDLPYVNSTISSKAVANAHWRVENLREAGATLHMFLIDKLCEAEGLVAGELPHGAYGSAIRLLLWRSTRLGLSHLSKPALQNVRYWAQRTKEICAVILDHTGDNDQGPLGDTLRLVARIEDDGKLSK